MQKDLKNSNNLSVRCPSCRQRFEVEEELRDRAVECGSCDSQFRIDDEVIIQQRKIYPGEHRPPILENFKRIPRSASQAPASTKTIHHAGAKPPYQLEPASPQQVIAGFTGAVFMVSTAFFLIFSFNPDGSLFSIPSLNKLVIACFVALLSSILLIYANPNNRGKAFLITLILSGGLISLPLLFESSPDIPDVARSPEATSTEPLPPEKSEDPESSLREKFGTEPLQKEQKRSIEAANGKNSFGIYLTNLVEQNRYTARDYLIRETLANLSSHPYPRDGGNYLMVLTDVSFSFEEVTEIARKLGQIEEVHPEISVIVVKVNNDQFLAGSPEKLDNPDDADFYKLNKEELKSIDIDRVERAVQRIAKAPAVIYRKDIAKTLTELLKNPRITFHAEISEALIKWTDNPDESAQAAIETLNRYIANDQRTPESLVALAVATENPAAIRPVHSIWLETPNLWENYLSALGPDVAPLAMAQLNADSLPLIRSAITVLGAVGNSENIPALKRLLSSTDPEVRLLAQRAIVEINSR